LLSIVPVCFNLKDNGNDSLLVIGISGFISSLAFIMPGISGSMLLLVLGVYDIIIISMSDIFNFYINGMNYNSLIICIVFGFSFFIGAVFFSKIIKKFLRDYKQIFLTISLGLLIGMLCLMSFDILQSNINSFLMILISCIGIITIKFFGE
jgi:putative membrane protein